jgi:hypothetical protein
LGAAALTSASALKTFTSTRRFLARAEPDHVDAVDRDVVLGHQVLHHRVGAAPAQPFVVLGVSDAVGIALHRDEEALPAFDLARQFVEFGPAIGVQRVLIEGKGDGHRRLQAVVVQIRDHRAEAVDVAQSLVSGGLRGNGVLPGAVGPSHGFPGVSVSSSGSLARSRNAALRALVYLLELRAGVVDRLRVSIRLFAHLVYFRLDGGRRISHIFLCGAPASKQRARQDASRSQNLRHKSNLATPDCNRRAVPTIC